MNKIEFNLKKEEFIEYLSKQKNSSLHTQESYLRDLNQFELFWVNNSESSSNNNFENNSFEEILKIYFNELYNTQINISSIARKTSCFNSFIKFLAVRYQIKLKIKLKRPNFKLKEPETLNIPEILQIMDFEDIEDFPTKYPQRDKAVVELIYATGLKCSEIIKVEFNHINFSSKTIVIRNKSKKERVVLFGPKTLKQIKKYIEIERVKPKSYDEKLFLNHRDQPLTTRAIQKICNMFKFCFESDQTVTSYLIRSSFASHLLNNGAQVEFVQKLLGHKTRISTERYLKSNKSK